MLAVADAGTRIAAFLKAKGQATAKIGCVEDDFADVVRRAEEFSELRARIILFVQRLGLCRDQRATGQRVVPASQQLGGAMDGTLGPQT